MPFHAHHSHHSPASPNQPGIASGIYHAAQVGAIGAPTANLRLATSGTTSAGTDSLLPGSGNAPGYYSGGHPAPPSSAGLPPPGAQPQQLETPRRLADRTPAAEELHMAGSNPGGTPQQQSMYTTPNEHAAGAAPGISLHQATPQSNQYSSPTSANSNVPGSLQPAGGAGRPGPASSYTAPTTVPTMPHINTNAQQYTLPTRSNTMNQGHNYSRSSPAGLDQKYMPFPGTPDKYTPTASQKAFSPQTPYGGASQSPLGLEHIRPRVDANLVEGMGVGLGSPIGDSQDKQPTNSNCLLPWATYAYDWCKWPVSGGNSAGKMAVGSYLEDPHNFIRILDTQTVPQEVTTPGAPGFGIEYATFAEATCSYPVTRILWEPPSSQKQSTDLLATSGDHLRLWSLPQTAAPNVSNTISRSSSVNNRDLAPQKLTPLALLSNSKTPEHTAPLTSLDWNTLSPKLIITSSIDTTCTIWDIPTLTAKTQLIAHDKEVFDVRFCAGSVDVFVSCGADGSVRMFDLRSLEHSTIIYEPSEKGKDKDTGTNANSSTTASNILTHGKGSPAGRMSPTKLQQTMSHAPPLLRLAASPHDSHLLATFAADSPIIRILDVRQPGQALLELRGHSAALNTIEWSPSRRGMLASGADDSQVLLWDLLHAQNGAQIAPDLNGGSMQSPGGGSSTVNAKGPAASWRCDYEVGNLSWAPQSHLTGQGGEWIGISGGRGVWGVKL